VRISEKLRRIAPADDFDGVAGALSYWDAQAKARELHRGTAGDDGTKLQTVAQALTTYNADLEARGGETRNVRQVENRHLPPSLASKLVAQLNARELRAWRDGLLDKGLDPGSVTRYSKAVKGAFNHAAALDPRITNTAAWKIGLASLPDSSRARNVILKDQQVRSIVAAAYDVSRAFGLLIEVMAVTGARPVQLRRLNVGDVLADRLDMPSSKKGNKGRRTIRRRPVPIPVDLATRLKAESKGRPADAPLLTQDNGEPWGEWDLREPFRTAVTAAKSDPDKITPYALRHSSIVRQLLKNVPVRICADQHDTSVAQIEAHYSKYIAHHADELVRGALIDLSQPVTAGKVVPMTSVTR
jgi:integrase